MNKNKLESIMKLHGDTGGSLSEYIGVSRQRFSCKKNEKNGAEFTQTEITLIKQKYSLTPREVDEIFFESKVS